MANKPDPFAAYQQPLANDPFAAYQQPLQTSSPAAAPQMATQPTSSPGPLDRLAQWGADTFPNTPSRFSAEHPATTAADTAEEFGRPGGNIINAGLRNLTALPAGAVDWVKEGVEGLSPSKLMHPIDTISQRLAERGNQPGTILRPGAPLPKVTADQAEQYATDTAGGLGAGLVAGEVASGALRMPGLAKDAIRGNINEPIAGGTLTPAARYASAKRLGVNLDAADATNSPIFGAVKRVNSNSLFGGPTYDAAKARNTSALTGSTNSFLDQMYPGDRESGGVAIQKALKQNQSSLQSGATAGFDSLPQDIPVPGLEDVGKTAQDMAAQNSKYQGLFPSLTPKKTMGVVGDVSGLGPQPPAPIRMSPFVDESGHPLPSSIQPAPQQPHSFSTAQKLRSDLLDFRRNNPDIVANQGDAMIGNLAGKTDEAITGASSLLNPQQLQTFRDANAAWGDMKQTYDDPSSPFYHAVRTDNPSSLYGGVGSKTPENARNLLRRLSPPSGGANQSVAIRGLYAPGYDAALHHEAISDQAQALTSPAVGALRRGTVEGALKTTNDGSPNFRTFGTQLNRIPADYRAELFSPDQNRSLHDIANTSNALSQEFNPSGSGHQVQKLGEAASLLQSPVTALAGHPLLAAAPVAYNAAQYGAAKLMNSPAFVERLMSPTIRRSPLSPPLLLGKAALFGAPAGNYGGLYGNDDKKKKAR